MRRQAVRILRLSLGGVLLLLGVIGGFIPVLQGWVFIVAGLSVMAPESTLAREALDWAKQKLRRSEREEGAGRSTAGNAQSRPATGADEDAAASNEKAL